MDSNEAGSNKIGTNRAWFKQGRVRQRPANNREKLCNLEFLKLIEFRTFIGLELLLPWLIQCFWLHRTLLRCSHQPQFQCPFTSPSSNHQPPVRIASLQFQRPAQSFNPQFQSPTQICNRPPRVPITRPSPPPPDCQLQLATARDSQNETLLAPRSLTKNTIYELYHCKSWTMHHLDFVQFLF